MTDIPRELIDAILGEVKDMESLKRCALSAPALRGSSQRILLHSMSVHAEGRRDYNAACALLAVSPHVATYITRFTVYVSSSPATPEKLRSFQQLLSKLTHVRRCAIRGGTSGSWHDFATLVPALFEFILRSDLTKLHVLFVSELPIPALAVLVSSAPQVSFYNVGVDTNGYDGASLAGKQSNSKLQQLLVLQSDGVCDVLGRPQFAPSRANLRRLSVRSADVDISVGIFFATANTLEHIGFHYRPYNVVLDHLPYLPVLRSVDIPMESSSAHKQHLIDSVASIVVSRPPCLEEIIITYRLQSFHTAFLRSETVAALDAVLGSDATAPRIRWRLSFGWGNDIQTSNRLADFAALVRVEMPTLYRRGKVTCERYYLWGEEGEWALR
ncbi:hypothetical protein DFH07DRAFT_823277 [Mycena maculata]|uniref:Uncharacterized protein n=1 Tax=Mycena maculata TaxID=230809 RepID=A0AAD7NCM8_9AGAR|nr:hypothetical protein DFH07DRAFT_823277 [Mycena maculata]